MIYTIGHSTGDLEQLVRQLRAQHVKLLVDIRSMPGSNKFPWFNKENLQEKLKTQYMHISLLGGRRKKGEHFKFNEGWENESFMRYADYMQTEDFKVGLRQLYNVSQNKNVAIMCAEAVWWRCHRRLVADQLVQCHVPVMDIICMSAKPHEISKFADKSHRVLRYPK